MNTLKLLTAIFFGLIYFISATLCAEDNVNYEPKWSYSSPNDPMTSKSVKYAKLSSENIVDFSFPYSGKQVGKLVLRNHPTHGKEVMFMIDKGQILCNTFSGCNIEVRFDENKAEKWKAVGPSDNSNNVLFIQNEKPFLKKLLSSEKALIKVPFYQQGDPVFEFYVSGLKMDMLKSK